MPAAVELPLFQRNVLTCLRCDQRDNVGNSVVCRQSGRDVARHSEADYCPVKKYGEGVEPAWWARGVAPPPPPRENDVDAARATCQGCEHFDGIQTNQLYVDCLAAGCGGCGVAEVGLRFGTCPRGKWG